MGGRGNASYKTSTNRAPRQHQPGEMGEEMYVWLRLKLLADAGLEIRDVLNIGAGPGKKARPRYLDVLFTRWATR